MIKTYEEVLKYYKEDNTLLQKITEEMNNINSYVKEITINSIKCLNSNEELNTIQTKNFIWKDILKNSILFLNRVYRTAGYEFYTEDIDNINSLEKFAISIVDNFFNNRIL